MEISDSVRRGYYFYKDIYTAQHEDTTNVFRSLLKDCRPSRILEIGTSYGGMTLVLSDLIVELSLDCKILSYDISECKGRSNHVKESEIIELRIKNLFPDTEEAIEFIQQEGITIVLCDGGNKIMEFNTLAPLLKKGDIIMAHDYCPNMEVFESEFKDKIWNWMEISDKDIAVSLNPFMSEEFKNVGWLCRIK